MATVDVIIPCYKYGKYLRKCVESAVNQTDVEVRVLIIDDNSPDNTGEISTDLAGIYSQVSVIKHRYNLGHIRTYNEGLEWAAAEYTLLLSADDLLLPNALASSAYLLDRHPHVGFTFGKAYRWDDERIDRVGDDLPLTTGDARILDGHAFIKLAAVRNIVPTPTALVRTKLQKLIGGYKNELPHSGDMEMWLRFAAHGSVGMLNQYLAIYRQHEANMSKSYQVRGWLPDLVQREAAIRYFLQQNSTLLKNSFLVENKMLYLLGREAFKYASLAFNLGESRVADDLEDFGRAISPYSVFSDKWLKLNAKKCFSSIFHLTQFK